MQSLRFHIVKKTLFRPSKWPQKFRNRKNAKNSKLPKNSFQAARQGGCPLISYWINPPPLGRNGIHYVEFPHHMRKFLLNLAPGGPLSLVQELPYFDNPIKLDPLLTGALDLCVHDMIIGFLFHDSWLIYVSVNCSTISEVSNNGGKYGQRRTTLKTRCRPRKGVMLSAK